MSYIRKEQLELLRRGFPEMRIELKSESTDGVEAISVILDDVKHREVICYGDQIYQAFVQYLQSLSIKTVH
jgi:hypothetical protein